MNFFVSKQENAFISKKLSSDTVFQRHGFHKLLKSLKPASCIGVLMLYITSKNMGSRILEIVYCWCMVLTGFRDIYVNGVCFLTISQKFYSHRLESFAVLSHDFLISILAT
ncbi:hypothetical protein M758_9G017100 [Ceratodon purpureus]|uniref:Uncharacterized protein n=1 Tax=Ceratodon purpureus TaxID=3225 RepID=A0A8T0GMS3_CERPU|nr:hypothetical protein KC19_9G017400 [Ceratodon purpureus]KAG0604895.1 hypothetical protein M758_9G017100 [Ceratodon purpureus]